MRGSDRQLVRQLAKQLNELLPAFADLQLRAQQVLDVFFIEAFGFQI